jgi:hypothetical protein
MLVGWNGSRSSGLPFLRLHRGSPRLGRIEAYEVGQDSAERVVELVTLLAVASKVLAELIERLQKARAAQISALAKTAVEQIVSCCADAASLDYLPSESVEALHADLVRLGRILQAEIAGIIKLRWEQLESGGASQTRH